MKRELTERSDTSLEQALEGIPQVDPPADLRQRCLARIRGLAAEERARTRRSLWRPVMQAAAMGAAMTALAIALAGGALTRARMSSQPQPAGPAEARLDLGASDDALQRAGAGMKDKTTARDEPPAPAGKAGPPPWPGGGGIDRMRGGAEMGGAAGGPGGGMMSPGASLESAPVAGGGVDMPPRTMGLPEMDELDGRSDWAPSADPAIERPWRDSSGERQQIVRRELELGVRKVDEAFDRAESIVKKAKGFLEDVEMRQEKGRRPYARFTARVPIDRLDGVIAQLRELGEVIRLRQEADDVSKEYWGRGEDIRRLGADEEMLVKKYLVETNKTRKQELYDRIMVLRQTNASRKKTLQSLSEQTHLAVLEVTLRQQANPWEFTGSALRFGGVALAWTAATAIVWLPITVLVIALLRREREGRPDSE